MPDTLTVFDLSEGFSAEVFPSGKATFTVKVWQGPHNSRGSVLVTRDSFTHTHAAGNWAKGFVTGWLSRGKENA